MQAREQLRRAVEAFDELGAAPWAERARRELLATGETARRRDASTLDQLTPRELQVALVLADGHTTREAAAKLFLSPKTVDYHLRHVYRKLGDRLAPSSPMRSGRPWPKAQVPLLMRTLRAAAVAPRSRSARRHVMATRSSTIDEAKVEQFVHQAVGELGATLNAALVVIGDRLGLYKAMAGAGRADPGRAGASAPARASATCASGSTRRPPAAT